MCAAVGCCAKIISPPRSMRRDVPFEIELLAHIMAASAYWGDMQNGTAMMTPRPPINQCRLISQWHLLSSSLSLPLSPSVRLPSFAASTKWIPESECVCAWPTQLFDNREIIKFEVEEGIGNTVFALRCTSFTWLRRHDACFPKGQNWNEHAAWEPFWYHFFLFLTFPFASHS